MWYFDKKAYNSDIGTFWEWFSKETFKGMTDGSIRWTIITIIITPIYLVVSIVYSVLVIPRSIKKTAR